MKITVIGVGHVGLVSAAAMASWGHDVIGMDDDAGKIEGLNQGVMPFFEPGMEELVTAQMATGRLRFSTDAKSAIRHAEVAFVCVGTPSLPGGGPNLSYVEAVGRRVAAHADQDLVVVEKSTVPAQTGERLHEIIEMEQRLHDLEGRISVASSPEFLRQGAAVQDTLVPDRIVIGYQDDWAGERLREVFAHVVEESGCPLVETDLATAELIKHASNGYLAMRISYVNNLALLCERVGANVDVVTAGMGHDDRIGPHFLRAGIGYGGSCFPKDLDAFVHLTEHLGQDATLMRSVRVINATMRDHVIEKLRSRLWHFDEKVVTILGASFKPDTDDTREAPGLHIGRQLAEEGATVRVYDPVVDELPDWAGDDMTLTDDLDAALAGAHAALVATEWPEIRAITPDDFKAAMAYPIVIDGRNVYDVDSMRNSGIMYDSIGRP